MRGKFGNRVSRRFAGTRPTRVWAGVSGEFALSALAAGGKATIIQLQAPTALSNLTADPPEDLTILRLRGSFSLSLSAAATAATWTVGLIVQDTEWTQGASFLVDSDKRWLWTRTFSTNSENAVYEWYPPGYGVAGTTTFFGQVGLTDIDISPKVRIEAGKALYLVAYEVSGTRALSLSSADMRVLFQRTARRR